MKSLLFINERASFFSGTENYVFSLSSQLIKRGIETTLLYNPEKEATKSYLDGFTQAFPLALFKKQCKTIKPDVIYVQNLENDALLFEEKCPNTIYMKMVHDPKSFCLRGCKLSLFSNQPCLSKGPSFFCYPLGFSLRREEGKIEIKTWPGLKKSLRRLTMYDKVLAASDYMIDQLIASGIPKERCKKCLLSIPAPLLKPDKSCKEKNHFLYAGQLTRGKGVDLLIEAIKHFKEEGTLTILGEGPLKETLKRKIEEYSLQKKVFLLGRVESKELESFYRKCQTVLLPNRAPEPFGLVGPEALRYGTSIITTNLGGVDEWLIDSYNGFFIPPNDPLALAKKMEEISSKEEFYQNGIDTYEKLFKDPAHLNNLSRIIEEEKEKKYG